MCVWAPGTSALPAAHILSLYLLLYSFLQILCLYDSVDALDVDKVVEYIKGLQQEDGSFAGDKWGEPDLLWLTGNICSSNEK